MPSTRLRKEIIIQSSVYTKLFADVVATVGTVPAGQSSFAFTETV